MDGANNEHLRWKNWNIAVTGMNSRADNHGIGCAVARCLREHGDFSGRVVGLGYDALDAGLYARDLCHSSHLIPYAYEGKDVLFERILELHLRERFDAIIPCLDAEIANFIAIRRDCARHGIAILLPTRTQFLLRANDNLSDFCQALNILAPDTKVVTNAAFFDICEAGGWKFPLIIKGTFYESRIARNVHEAKEAFYQIRAQHGDIVIAQKLVSGEEFSVAAVGDGLGGVVGTVIMRKRAVNAKGEAWSGVSVVDERIEQTVHKVLSALAWRGPMQAKVMKTDDGNIYMLEIKPRLPSWVYLTHAVGRNLPISILKLLSGDSKFRFPDPRTGTSFIRYTQDVIVHLPEFQSSTTGYGELQTSECSVD